MLRRLTALLVPVLSLCLFACAGPQSTLAPAGPGAAEISSLFWLMAGGGLVIWLVVIGTAVIATQRARPIANAHGRGILLIVGGGIAFPAIVLAALLARGLSIMPGLDAPGEGLVIEVEGEQWWWRLGYRDGDTAPVVSANEIRMPVGERVEFVLTSADVIHAFWIPSLGGKRDMIPGRKNRLVLEATKTGRYRGACAEYCGASHALMAFDVIVMERPAFEDWLAAQALPAPSPDTAVARQGQTLFLNNGCGACHQIRGTAAEGRVGPDLTHIGSRLSIAAGSLPNSADTLQQWTAHAASLKPDALMPAYAMLNEEELRTIAAYLESLK